MSDHHSNERAESPLFIGTKMEHSQHDPRPFKHARHDNTDQSINYHHNPVQPYDREKKFDYEIHEALPSLPLNHPMVKVVMDLHRECVQEVLDVIQESKGADSEIAALSFDLTANIRLNPGTKSTVGVVGDTGAGKSTFETALLGKDNLAKMVCSQ